MVLLVYRGTREVIYLDGIKQVSNKGHRKMIIHCDGMIPPGHAISTNHYYVTIGNGTYE